MKLISRLLCGALLLASLAACDVSSNTTTPATAQPAPVMTSAPAPNGGAGYPAPGDATAYPAPGYPSP